MIEPWAIALGVAIVSLLVYLRTMCRTIYVGDSGELAAAVHVLGIPHPPGYPLYVLLGKLFSVLLPIGRPALRLNIFSAVCASAAVAFLFLSLNETGLFDRWVAASAALAFAFSSSLWSQAGIPRVYALGALISSASTFLFVRWIMTAQPIWLMAAVFVIGLGLANHPVVGAHIPAMIAAIIASGAKRPNGLLCIEAGACLLPGILLYFTWIPIRARFQPHVNWGNIRTWNDLRRFLGRKEYWRHRWVHSFSDVIDVLSFYTRQVASEYSFLGAAAIVVGIPIAFITSPAAGLYVLVLVVLNLISMIAHARREDIFHWTRYMITAWFALSLPLAFGWQLMLGGIPFEWRIGAAFLLPAFLLVTRFRRHDLSRHRHADTYNRRLLESLPENATLIAQDDNVVFPLMYLRYAENVRPDIKLLEQGVHQLAELRFNPKRDAIYCTHWQAAFNQPPTARGPGLRLVGEGLIYRIVSTDMSWQPRDLWEEHLLPDMEDPRIPRNYLTRCLLGNVYFMRAEWELARDAVSAAAWYARAARMAYDSAVLHYNLGLCYERQGWKLLSQDAFARAAEIDRAYTRENRSKPSPAGSPPGSARPVASQDTGSRA